MASSIFVRRIQGEKKLLEKNPSDWGDAYFEESDPRTWYFLLVGSTETPFYNGRYLGKIMLPNEYPYKAPDFMFLTPSGRFQINHKICLSNSGYHPESGSPAWNIMSILQGMLSIMNDPKERGIAHIHEHPNKQKDYAKMSHEYNMTNHKDIYLKFNRFVTEDGLLIEKPIVPEKKKKKSKSKDKSKLKEKKSTKESKTKFKKIDV